MQRCNHKCKHKSVKRAAGAGTKKASSMHTEHLVCTEHACNSRTGKHTNSYTRLHTHARTHARAHMHACMHAVTLVYTHAMRTHTAGHIKEPHLTVLSMPPDTQTLDPSKGLAATPNTTTWPWIFIACFSRPLAISQTLWVRTCVCFWE